MKIALFALLAFTQTAAAQVTMPALAYFFGELARRRSRSGGVLADEVGVVISSELGRFPILNDAAGKDHLPELPMVLAGPGIRPGQYGETDGRLLGTPVSPRTGRPGRSRRDFVPTLDDVGASILHWFGLEDTRSFGYDGRQLDFLFA